MKQVYHTNATTNIHIRSQIHQSHQTNRELADIYNISTTTVSKWRHRTCFQDKSSRPHTIHYALTSLEQTLIKSIRTSTWWSLDEVCDIMQSIRPSISKSSVYRTFVREGFNKIPEKEKEKAKKFKAYEPGYLHIDVTYLPQLDGKKWYLFVAIDRATRVLFYDIYPAKTADNAVDFINKCKAFFPFKITHILTDNGLEFTNALLMSKKGEVCTKPSKVDELCKKENIEHRLTKPNTPKTNGMVERVNGIIKSNTILKETYSSKQEMTINLFKFLVFYLLYRKHGSLRRELGVRTPFGAVEKWFELRPEIFRENPCQFKYKILTFQQNFKPSFHQQPGET